MTFAQRMNLRLDHKISLWMKINERLLQKEKDQQGFLENPAGHNLEIRFQRLMRKTGPGSP